MGEEDFSLSPALTGTLSPLEIKGEGLQIPFDQKRKTSNNHTFLRLYIKGEVNAPSSALKGTLSHQNHRRGEKIKYLRLKHQRGATTHFP